MIGREKEVNELERLYKSDRSEFVAVYGRRRVGKTYLVDEIFKDRLTFRHTGLSPADMEDNDTTRPLTLQLRAFYYSLLQHGMKRASIPKDWLEAFFMLESFLNDYDTGERQVVFLDELPWMDTPKSGFITALESFWNGWGCHRNNLMLIVCGSANSWILDHLINNHGGLYNRLTYEIKLEPFTLRECELFLLDRDIHLSRYDIVQSYMILGGIPYYFNYFERGKSLPQIIDHLFFSKNAKLKYEYNRLFSSVFSNPERMQMIVEILAEKNSGYNRQEIIQKCKLSSGGWLTSALDALIISDFVEKYIPFGEKKNEFVFKVKDPFCIFYLRFVKNKEELNHSFWQVSSSLSSITSWRGFAFENVCFNHIDQIKNALGVRMVSSKQSSWNYRDDNSTGTQVDLIIERNDNVVNMCEIKFNGTEHSVDKEEDLKIRYRQSVLTEKISKKSVVHNTLITTFGLKYGTYSSVYDNVVIMDDLFNSDR
jgi:AAA+ ATPase superfamily predicted ATPase